jgi:phosphotransferase system HPr (HPr) family protein
MPSITLTVRHSAGLHARPAALFVKTAASFPCTIKLSNLARQKPPVNAKSALSVLTQAVNQGDQILVEAEGESAEQALAALKQLVESDFGEGKKD